MSGLKPLSLNSRPNCQCMCVRFFRKLIECLEADAMKQLESFAILQRGTMKKIDILEGLDRSQIGMKAFSLQYWPPSVFVYTARLPDYLF